MAVMRFPSLYFVTPGIGVDSDAWLKMIYEAVIGGVAIVQVRDKVSSSKRLLEVVRHLKPILQRYAVPLIINDWVDIALTLNADGVHVGQNDLDVAAVRARLGPKAIVGVSIENVGQLSHVAGVDYIAASPVFATSTKENAAPPWGLNGLRQMRALTSLPIVAIGGINKHNVPEVLEAGADSIAVVSAIASAASPRQAAEDLIRGISCSERALTVRNGQ